MSHSVALILSSLLVALGMLVGLCGLAVAVFAVHGARLARRLSAPASACGEAAADPAWQGLLRGRAEGTPAPAPLSGKPAVWWHVTVTAPGRRGVVSDVQSSDVLVLADDTGRIGVHGSAVDPHPDSVRRWACAADPLADRDAARPRELKHGAVSPGPYTATEYAITRGQTVVVQGVRGPEGVVRAPAGGGSRFFATRSPERIARTARRGSASMARLAAVLFCTSAALVAAGVLLRVE